MRGYFAIGAENISKPMNLGALMRTAHAFGASFLFTVNAHYKARNTPSDTSKAGEHVPYYAWGSVAQMALPKGCRLVGVEITEDAEDLLSFRHPSQAAYVLGPERGILSDAMLARCDFVVKIPTAFAINVATAGAIVMYDRMRLMGRRAERPVRVGGPGVEAPAPPSFGAPRSRRGVKT